MCAPVNFLANLFFLFFGIFNFPISNKSLKHLMPPSVKCHYTHSPAWCPCFYKAIQYSVKVVFAFCLSAKVFVTISVMQSFVATLFYSWSSIFNRSLGTLNIWNLIESFRIWDPILCVLFVAESNSELHNNNTWDKVCLHSLEPKNIIPWASFKKSKLDRLIGNRILSSGIPAQF